MHPPPAAAKPRPALRTVLGDSFEHTPRALAMVYGASRSGTVLLVLLTVMSAVLPVGIAFVGKRIVDAVVAHDANATTVFVVAELALAATMALCTQGLTLTRQLVGARLGLDTNLAILDKALGLELAHFEDSEFYDRLTRARREASVRPLSVVSRTLQLLQSMVGLAGYAALLLQFSGWYVTALLLAAVPATVAEMRFSTKAFNLRNWRSPESRKLMYLEHVLANDEHAKEVKLLGLGPTLLGRYRDLGETFYREDRALSLKRAGYAYALSVLATATFYGCYVAMALRAAHGGLSLGEMTLAMVAFRQGQQAFQGLLGAFSGMYEDNLYMSNLVAYLGVATEPVAAVTPSDIAPTALSHEQGIRFVDVGFRYPGREEWALRHISLFIPKGQSLALVGQNGAGKTTFIKLLTRLYRPTEGRVSIDGKDLGAWNQEDLLRRIAVVFQDFAQYQFSARENIGFGSVAQVSDDPQIRRAIVSGGAESVVDDLKAGLETPLGRWFKDGVELSGGQWQKIALARAFMREEADILVLDEPTAALDAEAEHAVFTRFRELTRGKTSILISHRFPTVRMADRIIVIERGQVVEQGTHDELVHQQGRYAALFALQAQGYL